MSNVALIAVGCGLIAAISWGICDFWAAKASRAVGPITSVIAVNGIGLAIFALFYLVSGQGSNLQAAGSWYAVGAGVVQGLGLISFYHALEIGPVSLVSPLSSAYPLVTTVCMLLLFQAQLSIRQVLGVGIVMLGVLAASELFSIKRSERRLGRGPTLALVTAIAWGISYTLMSQALETVGWQTASLVQVVFIFLIGAVLAPTLKSDEKLFTRANIRSLRNIFIVGAGLTQMIGVVIINIGIEQDSNLAPVVAAVSACYPVLTILLALKHFKEDLKLIPIGGAVITIIGVILLSLG